MEILRRLAEAPSYGYQLHKDVGVSTPTIYRHLNDLEDAGMVKSTPIEDDSRDKTEYHITDEGQQLLELLGD
ncbi:PadR family transcriptional regulator [Halorussus caseinilyticus]|uniref:PadR family transcriptional regulator n=1 Tax=Halorussus caseinilyticus TaxID=3034025 RepID=A0ABD5WIZ3_9EURY|nr:PadR family transcriptional regulator [Halorussus sp. DT72]